MLNVSVKADTSGVEKRLMELAREQIPFATAYALTQTMKAAQREVQKEMPRVFDRPNRFTINSVYVKPATKTRQQAEVKIQDVAKDSSTRPVQWLDAEVHGGTRKLKGLEVLLQARRVMPNGWYIVPTSNAPLDAFGNVGAATITKIISQLQVNNAYNLGKNETQKAKDRRNSSKYRGRKVLARYFAVMPGQGGKTGHLPPGIWERVNAGAFMGPLQNAHGSIRPIFLYVQKKPRYRKRLDFYGIVNRTVSAQLQYQFRRAIIEARRTAKPS